MTYELYKNETPLNNPLNKTKVSKKVVCFFCYPLCHLRYLPCYFVCICFICRYICYYMFANI